MRFLKTDLPGLTVVETEKHSDDRGSFARTFCHDEFAAAGLSPNFVQCNTSYNRKRGTLRGMHYQSEPYGEAKLVRCTAGRIWDVAIDIRPDSQTYLQWFGVELSAESANALFVPKGFAHGFQTLTDDAEVFYQMSEMYHGEASSGVRWNDPTFLIEWPLHDPILSERDATYPDFR